MSNHSAQPMQRHSRWLGHRRVMCWARMDACSCNRRDSNSGRRPGAPALVPHQGVGPRRPRQIQLGSRQTLTSPSLVSGRDPRRMGSPLAGLLLPELRSRQSGSNSGTSTSDRRLTSIAVAREKTTRRTGLREVTRAKQSKPRDRGRIVRGSNVDAARRCMALRQSRTH